MKPVYVTRDSFTDWVDIWPVHVGIRKFHWCIAYGAAWRKVHTTQLYSGKDLIAENISEARCRRRYGFYPGKGTAWEINSRGKRTNQENQNNYRGILGDKLCV